MNFDSFDTGFEDFSEEIRESREEEERKEQLRQQMEAQQLEEEERIAADAEDPRNREGFGGVRGFAKEVNRWWFTRHSFFSSNTSRKSY